MEVVKKYLKQIVLFGIVGGILDYVLFVVLYGSGVKALDLSHSLDFWMPLVFILMAIYYCKKVNYDIISFVQCYLVGLTTSLIFVFIACVLVYVHVAVLDPNYFTDSITFSIQEIELEMGLGEISADTISSTVIDEKGFKYESTVLNSKELSTSDIKRSTYAINQLKETTKELYVLGRFAKLLLPSLAYTLVLSVFFRRSNAKKS